VPLDPELLLPGQDRIRGELGAVVAHDHAGTPPAFDDLVKLAHDTAIRIRLRFSARTAQYESVSRHFSRPH
jgi:hypothetical protein